MKKLALFGTFLIVGGMFSLAYGGAACCAAKSAAAQKDGVAADTAKSFSVDDCLAGIDLTDDQKEQVQELAAKCGPAPCSGGAAAKMHKGLAEILTADQLQTLKIACTVKGCWIPGDKG